MENIQIALEVPFGNWNNNEFVYKMLQLLTLLKDSAIIYPTLQPVKLPGPISK